jgi:hypothetical protein
MGRRFEQNTNPRGDQRDAYEVYGYHKYNISDVDRAGCVKHYSSACKLPGSLFSPCAHAKACAMRSVARPRSSLAGGGGKCSIQ